MNALAPFQYQGQQVRTVMVDGEPWFVAADVAAVLGHAAAKDMTRSLDDDEKGGRLVPTLGGHQEMTVISEGGLYRAIVQRQTGRMTDPETRGQIKGFQRWVTHEVLPTIRRTGNYSATPALPQTYADALRELASSVEAREAAEAKAAALQPAATAWGVMVSAAGDYAVDEAAKILSRDPSIEIGRGRLFTLMSEQRWIYRSGPRSRWHAYQSQVDNGRLVQRMSAAFLNPNTGEMEAPAPTIRVTPKGLDALHRILGGEAALVPLRQVTA